MTAKPKPEPPKKRVHTPMPRPCCAKECGVSGPVLQYVERRPDGSWNPYLAHVECVGTDAPMAPKPKGHHDG